MFIYVQWYSHGTHHIQAFHQQNKAIDYVIEYIEKSISTPAKKKLTKSAQNRPDQIIFQMNPGIVPAPPPAPGPQLVPMPDMHFEAPAPVAAAPPFQNGNFLELDAGQIYVQRAAPINTDSSNSKEFDELRQALDFVKANRTLENINEVINIYDNYAKAAFNYEIVLHQLNEVKVVT